MPIPQAQAVLKSYFETGDKPTQAQFAELIDTLFALFQNAQTTANAAVATAAAATSATGRTLLSCPGGAIGTVPAPDQQSNVQSITFLTQFGNSVRFRVNFTTPFVNIRYIVAYTSNLNIIARNAAYIDVEAIAPATRWELLIFGTQ